jgi:NAD(P)-dependent dehydrogenase (short-subunit alcohol dehydrogenase family)
MGSMRQNHVIFGGYGGIGRAIATRLVAQGHHVHLIGRDETALKVAAAPLSASFSLCDVTDPDQIQSAVVAAADQGPINGLCYAVGTINLKPLARLTVADYERDFRINALGAALAVQAALPAMKACEGLASVLLFSSVAVAQGFPAHASIAMAKGAVEGLTRSLATELAPKIRVNCIAPSLTRTPLAEALTGNAAMASAIAALHASGRLGEVDDIAPLACLLLGEEGSWITGQVIGVDGGRSTLRVKG